MTLVWGFKLTGQVINLLANGFVVQPLGGIHYAKEAGLARR